MKRKIYAGFSWRAEERRSALALMIRERNALELPAQRVDVLLEFIP